MAVGAGAAVADVVVEGVAAVVVVVLGVAEVEDVVEVVDVVLVVLEEEDEEELDDPPPPPLEPGATQVLTLGVTIIVSAEKPEANERDNTEEDVPHEKVAIAFCLLYVRDLLSADIRETLEDPAKVISKLPVSTVTDWTVPSVTVRSIAVPPTVTLIVVPADKSTSL